MPKRKIIKIDQEKCDGCGLCIPNCPEGALGIIDGKARLVGELYCDGLGACIGNCPEGAILIEEREAEKYDERKVMDNIISQGKNVIKAHLRHLIEHNQIDYYRQAIESLEEKGIENPLDRETTEKVDKLIRAEDKKKYYSGCPGKRVVDFRNDSEDMENNKPEFEAKMESQLRQWPIQLKLVPTDAPYLEDSNLLICADCVPFSYLNFHEDLLKGRALLVGCPLLDDIDLYKDKITEVLEKNSVKSITCAHMEVPCCFSLLNVVKSLILASKKDIKLKDVCISIKGEKLDKEAR